MSNYDSKQLSFGIPIQSIIRIKPNLGHYQEDLKLNGDRIGILDVNNKIREEYECANIYAGNADSLDIYESALISYLKASLEGVNVSILAFGTSGSGKTYTIQGEGNKPGVINFVVDAVFEGLEEKRYRLNGGKKYDKSAYNYRVKLRFIEIVNETVTDLLRTVNSAAVGDLEIVPDEWEGISIKNITWLPCSNAQHLIDLFLLGKKNRTKADSEYGPLHDKSTSIMTIEISQTAQNVSTLETTVLVSQVHFIDLPCHEKLLEEDARVREGNLSSCIFSLADIIQKLSKGDNYASYDGSLATQLMKDSIGGNSLSIGIFCLQNGDPIGSSLVLSYMRMLRNIMNYPVVNDSRLIGLLRKYRLEIIELLFQLSNSGTGSIDMLNKRIAKLEEEAVKHNMEKLRFNDERVNLNESIRSIKESYNKILKDKGDLQQQLIKSEEDKLRASKQVIELQIKIAEIQEGSADSTYSINTKLLQAEKEVKNALKKEEKAMVSIHQAEENMRKAISDKKEIEMEYISLKKNYLELSKKFNEEKFKTEKLSTELVNLVNTNNSLSNDADYLAKLKANLSNEQKQLLMENEKVKKINRDLEDTLMNARSEIENLRAEIGRYDLNNHRQQIEYDNRKAELERGYLQMAQKRDEETNYKYSETESKAQRLLNQDELMKSELSSALRKLKGSSRKITELEDHIAEYQKHDREISEECARLQKELEDARNNYRSALIKNMNDGFNSNAREDMIRSYNNRETQLINQVNELIASKSSLVKLVRGLRAYARSLKNLAEDWAPASHPLPQLLTMPPTVLLEDEDLSIDLRAQLKELERLRHRNAELEQEIKAMQAQLVANTEIYSKPQVTKERFIDEKATKERLINEIEYLRGNTPGSSKEIEIIRKERNDLKEENRKLHQEIRRNTPNEQAKSSEVDRLQKKIFEYEQALGNIPSGNPKNLQQKIAYLEEVLKKLERERSELSVRATMAEEQLKNMQSHMESAIQNYQKKISELTKIIQRGK
jgi:coiled-coil domain-containing protein 78